MMVTITLSPAQQRIVEGIRAFWTRRGIPPTIRDLTQETGYASTSTVHYHVSRLEDLGVVERDPGTARSIRLASERSPDAVSR